jgi:hypothetical protein
MRASAEAWLARNAPQAIVMIGGRLTLDGYTFARYMHSEVGSGTIEERIAVGEAAINQAKMRAGLFGNWRSKLNEMLIPNGRYGAIHAPDAYCASLGKPPRCNAARRWAATTRDPSIMTLLLAQLVVSGASGDFAEGAQTQWGPDAVKESDGITPKLTNPTAIANFVRSAAHPSNGQYYWVGPLPGVDPWHTWLVVKGPTAGSLVGQALIARGISALPLTGRAPLRPSWPANLPICDKPASKGQAFFMAALGLTAGALAAHFVAKRYVHPA